MALFVPLRRIAKGFLTGKNPVSVILASLLLILMTAAGLWDIYCIGAGKDHDTVSRILLAWSHEVPAFPLALGMIIGHLFWPQYVNRPQPLP